MTNPITRRTVLQHATVAAGAAALCGTPARRAEADPLGKPIGLQLYTVRNEAGADFEGTLGKVAEIGYTDIELYTFYGRSAADIRKSLDAAGLSCRACHFMVQALAADPEAQVRYAEQLGLKYIVCPYPGTDPDGPRPPATAFGPTFTAQDWKWNARVLARVGAIAAKAGIHVAHHNHHMELLPVDGTTGIDIILNEANPDHVKLEVDCAWVTVAGRNAAEFIQTHADRTVLLHIKDIAEPSDGKTRPKFTPVGSGIIDYPSVFKAAKNSAVEHYYVEQDTTTRTPLEAVEISYEYLRRLKA